MTSILRRLARDPAAGSEVFMSAPPHILAALIDDGLAVVDMSRGWPAMKITDKGREAAEREERNATKGAR